MEMRQKGCCRHREKARTGTKKIDPMLGKSIIGAKDARERIRNYR
jgi:hypothetical protein